MPTLEERTAVLTDSARRDPVDELVSERGVDLVGDATDPADAVHLIAAFRAKFLFLGIGPGSPAGAHACRPVAGGLVSNRDPIAVFAAKPCDTKGSGT
jgi:hypothetical protein